MISTEDKLARPLDAMIGTDTSAPYVARGSQAKRAARMARTQPYPRPEYVPPVYPVTYPTPVMYPTPVIYPTPDYTQQVFQYPQYPQPPVFPVDLLGMSTFLVADICVSSCSFLCFLLFTWALRLGR